MGLAEPRKRLKLSHDPNNTKWTGNKDSFGHRIMQAHGWQPGDYLGAINANHAAHYTAANASHIRVLIKDDNLGLGAKIGSGVGHGECTGLDAFKNLLGRLNGKDEDEIQKEQKSREDLKRAIYTERKWGSVRFVKGGFLIGDKIQDLIEGEADRIRKLKDDESIRGSDVSSLSSSPSSANEASIPAQKSKKSKKRKIETEEVSSEFSTIQSKKSKKKRKLDAHPEQNEEAESTVKSFSEDSAKRQRKKERRDRKERKQRKKELKERPLEESAREIRKSKKDKRKGTLDHVHEDSKSTLEEAPKESALINSTAQSERSTPLMQGRHAVRARNIAQKRLASMDVASLNQIFMIKTPS